MKLAIIGSRGFSDEKLAEYYFCKFFYDIFGKKLEIVSGAAKTGGDYYAKILSIKYNLHLTEYPPDWNLYGKSAGFKRNQQIIDACDFCLCFWDGISKGSQHSLGLARKQKKPTMVVYF